MENTNAGSDTAEKDEMDVDSTDSRSKTLVQPDHEANTPDEKVGLEERQNPQSADSGGETQGSRAASATSPAEHSDLTGEEAAPTGLKIHETLGSTEEALPDSEGRPILASTENVEMEENSLKGLIESTSNFIQPSMEQDIPYEPPHHKWSHKESDKVNDGHVEPYCPSAYTSTLTGTAITSIQDHMNLADSDHSSDSFATQPSNDSAQVANSSGSSSFMSEPDASNSCMGHNDQSQGHLKRTLEAPSNASGNKRPRKFPQTNDSGVNDGPVPDDSQNLFLPRETSSNLQTNIEAQTDNTLAGIADFNKGHNMSDVDHKVAGNRAGPKKKNKGKGATGQTVRDGTGKALKPSSKKAQQLANRLNLNFCLSEMFSSADDDGDDDVMATFETEDLEDAFQQLVENAPEATRDAVTTDVNQLRAAISTLNGRKSGSTRCKPTTDGKWALMGMTCRLEHYQALGAGLMRLIENRSDRVRSKYPRGGILADEMGLGKTVMTLSCITNARTRPGYTHQPTLLVLPVSVINQWDQEIATHVHSAYRDDRAFIYKATRANKSNISMNTLKGLKYVLTTYGEVQNSFPRPTENDGVKTEEDYENWLQSDEFKARRGHLHQIHWERVVLDEAHAIKNDESWTSRACCALDAKYYWALTGTPAPNRPTELYAYFKLVRLPGITSFSDFCDKFCDQPNPRKGAEALRAELSRFMIRRMQKHKFLGGAILHLPKVDEAVLPVSFSDFEREVYDIICERFMERMKMIVRSNTKKSQYSNIFSLFIRLRQLTGHILLAHDTVCDLLEPGDIAKLRTLTEKHMPEHKQDAALRRAFRFMLDDASDDSPLESVEIDSEPTVSDANHGDADVETSSFTQPGSGSLRSKSEPKQAQQARDSTDEYLTSLVEEKREKGKARGFTCAKCKGPASAPSSVQIGCGHIYCKHCFLQASHERHVTEADHLKCEICGGGYLRTHKRGHTWQDSEAASKLDKSATQRRLNDKISKWIDDEGRVLPSAKTRGIAVQINKWLEDDPSVKIIVFSQFVTMLELLRWVAQVESWSCVVYHGQMDSKARDEVLHKFKEDMQVNVMLMSLKAGGLGLNMTEATKVITVEPWWNLAIEQQAFCRVYRRGQTKPTTMRRMAVCDTIDERICNMQKAKAKEMNAIFNGVSSKMTMSDMMSAMGYGRNDAE